MQQQDGSLESRIWLEKFQSLMDHYAEEKGWAIDPLWRKDISKLRAASAHASVVLNPDIMIHMAKTETEQSSKPAGEGIDTSQAEPS